MINYNIILSKINNKRVLQVLLAVLFAFLLILKGGDNNVIIEKKGELLGVATGYKAKTVFFDAGSYYSSDGVTGQNTKTNQTLSSFTFSLAETEVSIKDAYVIYEIQYEAYSIPVAATSSFSFDACQSPCTPVAYTGTSSVTVYATSTVTYNSLTSGSNFLRFLLGVTSESQISSYTGGNITMNFQSGYAINSTVAHNSIASVKAILVLNYTYDKDSPSITNTVFYPLDSNDSLTGTKATSTNVNCTFNVNCPSFNYNMDIVEYKTKLSQWFQMENQIDLNLKSSVFPTLKISTFATSSGPSLSASSSDQGTMFTHYYTGVENYSENTTQTIQYRAATGTPILSGSAKFYLIGGEVAETYTASSSAATSTKTVFFPIGVITNQSTASTSNSINVFFPENGNTSTGTVRIKKAWFRIKVNNAISTATDNTINVVTKIGNNATSTNKAYSYNPPARPAHPTYTIIHTIPTSNYVELESATISASKNVHIETRNPTSGQGGVSVELVITYTYTGNPLNYLVSLRINAGQQLIDVTTAGRTVYLSTTMIAPDSPARPKTLIAGGINASYLISDSDGTVGATSLVGANVGTIATPACTNSYTMTHGANGVNSYNEFYINVKTSLATTTNNLSVYNTVFCDNGAGDANTGAAKKNGILIYTYLVDSTPYPAINMTFE
jgi:hypothetical protein